MKVNIKRSVARGAAAAVAAGGLALGGAAPAAADVVPGQRVTGYPCWASERVTGEATMGPVPIAQHALVYRNCSKRTVQRKANINEWFDGPCYAVRPGATIVLHTTWTLRGVFDESYPFGAKRC